MTKIDISQRLIIRITATAILILLAIFANFVAIRRMSRYAIEANFYDKLSVAYDIGGLNGLKKELARIKAREGLRHEVETAADFEKKLSNLKDPKTFIDNALSEDKKNIILLRNLRIYAFALILLIVILRIFCKPRP
jgi:hypothetical protein